MNPLSVWTYYRRHKRQAALLISLISLVTAGLYLMAALTWTIFTEPTRSNYQFLSEMSILAPATAAEELDPAVVAQIRTHPDVEQVLPTSILLGIGVPEPLGGQVNWLNLLALQTEDLETVLGRYDATLIEGDPLQPNTNGVLFSQKVAAALDVQVGDVIHNHIDPERYQLIVEPLEVVGILETDVRLGIISYEYVSHHELYLDGLTSQFIILAQRGRETAVDDFLLSEIQTTHVNALTYQELMQSIQREYQRTFSLGIPIAVLAGLAVTLVIGVINRIALTQRLPEFGILNATGHDKRWLARRLAMETAALGLVGWMAGILLSWLILAVLKWTFFQPNGHDIHIITLGVATLAPLLLVIPIPLSVIGFTLLAARRIFRRLDAVAVVEQGELDPESGPKRHTTSSQAKPLSSLTYSKRHKRRTLLLTSAMTLVIVAVALIIFIFAAVFDAQEAQLGELGHMSMVSAFAGQPLDPATVTRIRTQPTVEQAIPFAQLITADIFLPPFAYANISSYAVYEKDLHTLVELYNLELAEGHLPQPNSNEIVIPQVVAQNRDLKVGDVIGDPDHPAYPNAPNLPTPFTISGIFAQPTRGEENWLSFISLEFIENHEAFDLSAGFVYPLMVVPQVGHTAALENWLESEIASQDVRVRTYPQEKARHQERLRNILLALGLIEILFTVVTAAALAALNYLTISQRKSEFGVLNALGYGRWRIVARVLRETAFATGAAWGISVSLCLLGMLAFQLAVFTPLGLRMNLLNIAPWLYTLPTPAAVLVVTAATAARTLSRLDPVSIIERR